MFFRTNDKTQQKKILERCSKGNRKAQEHLYSIYYGYAMSIAIRYSNSKIEAEEIINDAFFKIFTNHQLSTVIDNFKPWFRKIIINTAIDHYRSQEKNRSLIVLEDIPETIYQDQALEDLDAEDIIELMQRLTPMYRMVFNLYIIEGYNHDEIAQKLNITPSTSRSNLTRAKQKLRELIKDYDYYGKAR